MHRTKSQLVDEINKLQRQTAALKSKISEIRSTHPPSAGGMIGGADGKFQKLVEGSIQGIIVVGLPDWRPLFINEAVAKMYGYGSAAEMMRLATLEGIVHPEDRPRMKRQDEVFKTDKNHFFNEFRGIRKDGSIIDIYDMVTPIEWDGEMALLATSIDITERKRAEEVLRGNDLHLTEVQRIGHIGYWAHNFEAKHHTGDKFDWSDELYRIFGLDPETDEATAEKFFKIVHPNDHERVTEAFETAIGGVDVYACEYRIVLPSKEIRYIQDRGEIIRNDSGKAIRSFGTAQDVTERKRVEQALQDSERRLQRATDNVPAGIGYIGTDERLYFANQTYADWFAMPRDEMLGKSVAELAGPERYKKVAPRIREALSGEPTSYEVTRQYPDGINRRVFLETTPNLAEDKSVLGFYVLATDVTDQRESEERLAEAQRIAAIGNWELDIPTGELYWSDEVYRIFGVDKNSFTPSLEAFLSRVHPEDVAHVKKFTQEGVRSGKRYSYEHRVVLPGGAIKWLRQEAESYRDQSGGQIRRRGTVQDITPFKVAQDALRESAAALAQSQQTAHLGSWNWDLATDQNHWSVEHYRIFGLDPSRPVLSYDDFISMLHIEDREAVKAATETALHTHRSYDIKYRLRRPDGDIRFVHAIGDVERDKRGKPVRMHGTVQDITERKEIEEQLFQAQKMEAVGQLTGGIAHDFNNLLTVILGNLELIRDTVSADGGVNKMIDRSVKAANRGADLTHRLLAFSRKQMLQPTDIDLNILVPGMMDMLGRTLGEGIQIKSDMSEGLWLCHADQAQLENALLNLSINARDAMPDGGTLTIEAANMLLGDEDSAARIDVEPGHYVMLGVSDSGSGIPEKILEHVFEPFFTTKDVSKGSGLGLSMVHGFAKQSGGTVTINSELNEGTAIKLYLPRISKHGE